MWSVRYTEDEIKSRLCAALGTLKTKSRVGLWSVRYTEDEFYVCISACVCAAARF